MATGKQICEAYVRYLAGKAGESLTDEEVVQAAHEFFCLSRTGELWHVFDAANELKEAGLHPDGTDGSDWTYDLEHLAKKEDKNVPTGD